MDINKKYLKNIIKANNDNRLTIFIGAGISKSSETSTVKIPSWDELIKDLKNDLELDKDESDYLKIAQLYFLQFGGYTYYEKLKSYFPVGIEPSPIHKLIFSLNPQYIITTNWDTLLEKTIDENAYIYDVISSDEQLVTSTLQKKLIKMHGDFKNQNIVFKEDDYLNYQDSFPLIENYIKSILSTNTVLFLGYSYNDVNLKQIVKWLQINSKYNPPRYLISFKENSSQEKYLENHNITVLTLSTIDEKYSNTDKYSEYSGKIATFLELLINSKETFNKENDNEVIDYIYTKLKILNELDGILLDQVINSLKHCRFIYTEDNLTILQFDTCIDQEETEIYQKFVSILREYEENIDKYKYKKDIEKIFDVLIKAGINGIIISNNHDRNPQYIPINIDSISRNEIVDCYFDFNFINIPNKENDISKKQELAFQNYQIQNDEVSFNLLEEVITLCLKQRSYTQLFLAMFNRNLVLLKLKSSHKDYIKYNKYDLGERFDNLPKDLKKAIAPIYNFVNFEYIYKFGFNILCELRRKESQKKTIEQGGIVLENQRTEYQARHENLVLFVLINQIMLDHSSEFQEINKFFLEISIIRQIQSNDISLNKIELYACIKYIDYKELERLFEKLIITDIVRESCLKISIEDKEWLIKRLLSNITELFIKYNHASSNYRNQLIKVIYLISFIKLDENEIQGILAIFLKIISDVSNGIWIFDPINKFLGIQHKLFQTKFNDDDILKIIETIIDQLIYRLTNSLSWNILGNNSISNFYEYAHQYKIIFNKDILISKLLSKMTYLDSREKIRISQSVLLNIYDISNDKIKTLIKDYILGIDIKETDTDSDYFIFELLLVVREFNESSSNLLSKIHKYLEQFNGVKSFSTVPYTLTRLLKYLVKDNPNPDFEELLNKTNLAIENNNKWDRLSIF